MRSLENRIPPPLVAVIIAAVMWGLSKFTSTLVLTALVKYSLVIGFVLIGIFFSLSGAISFRLAKTTVNPLKPEKASALVTSGIYKFTRNPMYVGFVWFLFAWATFLGTVWGIGLIFVYITYIQRFQIMPEERALTKLFKDEFVDYKAQVRPWL